MPGFWRCASSAQAMPQLRKRVEAFQEQLGDAVLEKDAALRDRVLGRRR